MRRARYPEADRWAVRAEALLLRQGTPPVQASSVAHGTLSLSANGGFTYTPAANYHGSDSFTYRASDGVASQPG